MAGPLSGIKVVEMAPMAAVPAAVAMLTSQGATSVKVEDTQAGDPLRHYGSGKNGMSGMFANFNGGKRSIALDLDSDEGKAIMWALLDQADVFIQGFRPGALDRLGFGSDAARQRNSQLVYVSSSGFGTTGPYADRPVYDPVIQALSGWAGSQTVDGAPTLIKGFVADKVAALTTAQAITAALFNRSRTGRGDHIEMSMLESNVAFNWPDVMMHTTVLDEDAAHQPNVLGAYQLFSSSDGWVSVTAGTDDQWRAVTAALGRPELGTDPRFATAAARGADFPGWYRVFGELCSAHSTAEIMTRCVAADVPAVPVLDPTEVFADEQIRAREAVVEIDHPSVGRMLVARPGASFESDAERALSSPAPAHGQHSDEILAELGYAKEAVDALRGAGVIR